MTRCRRSSGRPWLAAATSPAGHCEQYRREEVGEGDRASVPDDVDHRLSPAEREPPLQGGVADHPLGVPLEHRLVVVVRLAVGPQGLELGGGRVLALRGGSEAGIEGDSCSLGSRVYAKSTLGRLPRHLVPDVASTVVTAVTLQLPALVVVEATLSYLGLGDPSLISWGSLVSTGMQQFPCYWWVVAAPVVALLLTVVSLNVLGDALRDVLDARLE